MRLNSHEGATWESILSKWVEAVEVARCSQWRAEWRAPCRHLGPPAARGASGTFKTGSKSEWAHGGSTSWWGGWRLARRGGPRRLPLAGASGRRATISYLLSVPRHFLWGTFHFRAFISQGALTPQPGDRTQTTLRSRRGFSSRPRLPTAHSCMAHPAPHNSRDTRIHPPGNGSHIRAPRCEQACSALPRHHMYVPI